MFPMNLLTKLFWFIKRPALYPHLVHLILKKIIGAPNDSPECRSAAIEWCEARCITTDQALQKIVGKNSLPRPEDAFADVFADSWAASSACPVKMGGPGDLSLLFHCAESISAKNIVETGVAYGWSSLALLLSLHRRSAARLVSVDMPYVGLDNESYVGCVIPQKLKSNWTLIRRADRQGIPQALRMLPAIDMCHHDSDKSYDGRMWAYPTLWKALRAGGIFISDDIGDNLAFRDFAAQISADPTVIKFDGKYVGVLLKK